jgi:hypothetical protein
MVAMRRWAPIPVLTLAALIATAGWLLGDPRDTIIPAHGVHFANDVECATCHAGVEKSTSALETHRPAMETCSGCHDVEDPDLCAQCHTNVAAAVSAAPPARPARKFSHDAHVGRGMTCESCHGNPRIMEPAIPAKAECRRCHETAADYTDCGTCHAESERRLPVSHDGGWVHRHGVNARVDEASCETCHTQGQCEDCHSGDNVRPRSHGLNYVFAHANEARGNELVCGTCHDEREFCSSCHVAERVLPRSHSRVDWVRIDDGGTHADEARFDIESCMSCHEGGASSPICADCHGG